jgi:hypothetical protein
MGARIVGFIVYLALSYGIIYLLISKRFLRGWNMKEPHVRVAILTAIVLIIAVGTMLVGPLPMVLMVVALVAFIDYVRSSEALAAAAGDSAPIWRALPSLIGSIGSLRRTRWGGIPQRVILPSLIGSIGSSRRWLTTGSAYDGFVRIRNVVVPTARRVLAGGVEKLSGYVRSITTRELVGSGGELSAPGKDHADAAPALPDQDPPPPPPPPPPQPPPLSIAEGHGLNAVQAALAPPKPAERMLTRDEAKRLLDRLEGRA